MPKKVKEPLPLIADPAEAGPEHVLCKKCKLHENCNKPFMPAYIPEGWTGYMLGVGEAPGKNEDELGRPFVGRAGNELYNMLEEVGIKHKDLALTNANRCRPRDNEKPAINRIRLCRPFVCHDISSLLPKWILCLGLNAAKSVLNRDITLADARQRVFTLEEFPNVKIAVTYHPAAILYPGGKEVKAKILDDLSWLKGFRGYRSYPETPFITSDTPAVGLDTEFTANAKLVTLGLGWKDEAEVREATIGEWQPNPAQHVIGHNIYDDLAVLHAAGKALPRSWLDGTKVLDTVMLARLTDENRGAYDLESLSVDLCNIQPWKEPTERIGVNCLEWPQADRMERCRIDAWASSELARTLLPSLDKKLVHFCHVLAATLFRIEMSGLYVNQTTFGKLRMLLCKEMGTRAKSLLDIATEAGFHERFQFSNDNHIRTLLFDILGNDIQKRTDKSKQAAVDKPTLIALFQTLPEGISKEVIRRRLKYEKLEKLVSTYIVGVEKRLTPHSFLFPSINPLGARTGRRASSDPNLQNWPKRMRQMIVSRWTDGKLVSGDFSQLEPRILAEHAGIERWQEMFKQGKNLYLESAKLLWKKDIEKESSLYRVTKSTILGTNYGMEVDLFIAKLAVEQGVRLSRSDGQYILDLYHRTFPELPRYFALQRERILHYGYVSNSTGQRRHLPCPEGERTHGFKHLWNEAVNFPIQADAAYISGSALIDIEAKILAITGTSLEDHYTHLVRWWTREKKGLTDGTERDIIELWDNYRVPVIINEVHDEVLVDVPDENMAIWIREMMKEEMKECRTLRKLWPETAKINLVAEPVVLNAWK